MGAQEAARGMKAAASPAPVPAGEAGSAIYLARQPIFDGKLGVVAYEILFRSSAANKAAFADGNLATSQLITNTFVEMGLDAITSRKKAFINLTRDFLVGKLPLPFAPQNVVLEILEDISADAESIAGTKRLADQGFTIALDDFILNDRNRDLVPYARIVKVDIRPLDEAGLRAQVAKLKPYKVLLLAEKVETHREFALCQQLGFDLYQGYFFSKPVVLEGRQVAPNQLALLEILAKLQSPGCNLKEIEEIISYDVGITYKLLKIINSSYYSLNKKVESIQHALVIIGMKTLKSWITVISLSKVENKPGELIAMVLIRAKMCENLAKFFGCKSDAAFIVGLFSLLDVMLDQPRETLLATLPLSEDILAALLRHEGKLGALFTFVSDYEQGDWLNCGDSHSLSHNDAVTAYLQALQWSNEITQLLG